MIGHYKVSLNRVFNKKASKLLNFFKVIYDKLSPVQEKAEVKNSIYQYFKKYN
jgi:hypothetical protein